MFQASMQHAALFHSFMSHYIARFNIRFQVGDPAESVYHRTQAIKIVNKALEDPKEAISDGIISTVSNMCVYEVRNQASPSAKHRENTDPYL